VSFIKFLGTAGARFVMIDQLRSSGGIWISCGKTNVILDPGPGSLVRCHSSRPKLDPKKLDAVILTHKHLDHSGDVNVMIEAMTKGGYEKRGRLFAPKDAFGTNGVIFSYLKNFPEKTVKLEKGECCCVGDLSFMPVIKNIHPVDTYGLKFFIENEIISFVSDTRYFPGLIDAHKDATILILNVVFYEKRSDIDHMSIQEAIELIKAIKPKKAVITHFGMTMLKQKPYLMERDLQAGLEMDVQLAYDGYTLNLPLDKS
jgi:ribonuclease BN (tRNA processing enzyme)